MATYLDRLIDYDSWANQGLLDFLAGMPPETLDLTDGAALRHDPGDVRTPALERDGL